MNVEVHTYESFYYVHFYPSSLLFKLTGSSRTKTASTIKRAGMYPHTNQSSEQFNPLCCPCGSKGFKMKAGRGATLGVKSTLFIYLVHVHLSRLEKQQTHAHKASFPYAQPSYRKVGDRHTAGAEEGSVLQHDFNGLEDKW